MSKDGLKVWDKWKLEMFENQEEIETKYLNMVKEGSKKEALKMLTDYSNNWAEKVVEKAWDLGDFLWTKYDELF